MEADNPIGLCLGTRGPGIIHALTHLESSATGQQTRRINRPIAKMFTRAMAEAGIKESVRQFRVGPYQLGTLLDEADHYQEWEAEHAEIAGIKRRVRLYLTHGKTETEAARLQRAAHREFQILEGLQHPGILKALDYHTHDLGPALIFEHNPDAQRLDHYLLEHAAGQPLATDPALQLIREIAEALKYAHASKLYHRALSPQSILVTKTDSGQLRVKLFNWSTAERIYDPDTTIASVSPTSHLSQMVQEDAGPYLALEAHSDTTADSEYLDIFSLGAIAYHIFTGQKPAQSDLELQDKLRQSRGLQITDALNGASQELQDLIKYATHPDVTARFDSIAMFLEYLSEVEDALRRPDNQRVEKPTEARPGDMLEGGYTVKQRLGSRLVMSA